MPRKILMVPASGPAVDLTEVPADSELELQEVMKKQPQLLPAADLDLDGDLLVVGRETSLASGSVDLLCLSRSGELVIVEFKTGPQNPDFRHALAQVIDYGSDLWTLGNAQEFDQGLVRRYLNGPYADPASKGVDGLRGAAALAWSLEDEEWLALSSRLERVLATGDFHFVVAAQRFTSAMRASVEYLNETMRVGRFFLVELIRLDGHGQRAYAAQVVQRPGRTAGRAGASASKASEDEFLARIGDAEHREAMEELLAGATGLGLTLAWGAKGASIRIKSPDREEPISVGWVFLGADQWTWAKHVTFGVDPNSLAKHPTVAPAILAFCENVKALPGAQPAGGKSNAAIFEPHAFIAVHTDLVAQLDALVAEVRRVSAT